MADYELSGNVLTFKKNVSKWSNGPTQIDSNQFEFSNCTITSGISITFDFSESTSITVSNCTINKSCTIGSNITNCSYDLFGILKINESQSGKHFKFNKIKGKITIVTYLNEKQEFVFEIKDTGDGISKKDCAKIFNFFSQVNRNQLKRQQGSGVGLALCKTIARAHGGDLNFKSRLSYGSTFWFSIPQNQSAK